MVIEADGVTDAIMHFVGGGSIAASSLHRGMHLKMALDAADGVSVYSAYPVIPTSIDRIASRILEEISAFRNSPLDWMDTVFRYHANGKSGSGALI